MKCDLQFGLNGFQIGAADNLVHDGTTGRTEGRKAPAGDRFLNVVCNLAVRFTRPPATEAVAVMQCQLAPCLALSASEKVLEHVPFDQPGFAAGISRKTLLADPTNDGLAVTAQGVRHLPDRVDKVRFYFMGGE